MFKYDFGNDEYIEGNFKIHNGVYSGKGYYYWGNGDIYYGDFDNGNRSGFGTFYWADTNELYEGEFMDNDCHGKGYYWYDNGDRYEGDFQWGKKHGDGILYKPRSKTFIKGNFVNGEMIDGQWSNGTSRVFYEGPISNGSFHGQGIYTEAIGQSLRVIFEYGRRIKSTEQPVSYHTINFDIPRSFRERKPNYLREKLPHHLLYPDPLPEPVLPPHGPTSIHCTAQGDGLSSPLFISKHYSFIVTIVDQNDYPCPIKREDLQVFFESMNSSQKITSNHFQINIDPESESQWEVGFIANIQGHFNLYVKVKRDDIAQSPFRLNFILPGHVNSEYIPVPPYGQVLKSVTVNKGYTESEQFDSERISPSEVNKGYVSLPKQQAKESEQFNSGQVSPPKQYPVTGKVLNAGPKPQLPLPTPVPDRKLPPGAQLVLPPVSPDRKLPPGAQLVLPPVSPDRKLPPGAKLVLPPVTANSNPLKKTQKPQIEVVPYRCKATGPALSKLYVNTTSKFAVSLVDNNGEQCSAEHGKLDIRITDKNSQLQTDQFDINKDIIKGFHIVQLTSSLPGQFQMQVLINGQDIIGSPFNLNVQFPPVDPDMCTVKGPGISAGILNNPVRFAVILSDSVGNDLPPESGEVAVSFQDENGSNANAFFEWNIQQIRGINLVVYTAHKSGNYQLKISVNSEDISNSPFHITVPAEDDDDLDSILRFDLPPQNNNSTKNRHSTSSDDNSNEDD